MPALQEFWMRVPQYQSRGWIERNALREAGARQGTAFLGAR